MDPFKGKLPSVGQRTKPGFPLLGSSLCSVGDYTEVSKLQGHDLQVQMSRTVGLACEEDKYKTKTKHTKREEKKLVGAFP